ncbi:uncharacterized protein [Antedon mediterranea]|uniref:uncharacterized protein n=1 Tax=Antedon mediterranea TaxID=105859 RepID=UPI003AF921A4
MKNKEEQENCISCVQISPNHFRKSFKDRNHNWICYHCDLPKLNDSYFSTDESLIESETSTSDISIDSLNTTATSESICGVLFNARSLKNKLRCLQTYLGQNTHLSIIGITETWLTDTVPDGVISNQHVIFRKDRGANKGGGGVLLAIKPELHPIQVTHPSMENVECVWAEFSVNDGRWLCGVFYRPPSKPNSALELEEIVLQLHIEKDKGATLLGDFNINWLADIHIINNLYSRVSNWTSSLDFQQIVMDPTRITLASSTLIDLLFTNYPERVCDVNVLDPFSTSDHCVVAFKIRGFPRIKRNPTKTNFYAKTNVEAINEGIGNITWESIKCESVNGVWSNFITKFMECVNLHIPHRNQRRKTKPWIFPEIKKMAVKKRKLFNRARRSGNINDWTAYKKLRNKIRYVTNRSHSKYIDELMGKADNMKQFWQYVQSKRKSANCSSFVINDTMCSDPRTIANAFNSLFESYFTQNDPLTDESTSPRLEVTTLANIIVHPIVVFRKIMKLSVGKAAGPDGITSQMLKLCAKGLSPLLADVFNFSLESGELPSAWKCANIAPVHKKLSKTNQLH